MSDERATIIAKVLSEKTVQLLKKYLVGPLAENKNVAEFFQSLPTPVRMAMEWFFYSLGAVAHSATLGDGPFGTFTSETISDLFLQAGIQVANGQEQKKILAEAIPIAHQQVLSEVKKDPHLWNVFVAVFGTREEIQTASEDFNRFVSSGREKIAARKAARKARGIRRYL